MLSVYRAKLRKGIAPLRSGLGSFCNPMDCGLPAPSVHEILQARILEGGAISFSRGSSWPRDQTCISHISGIGRQVLYHKHHLGSPSLPSVLLHLIPLLFLFFVSLEKIFLKFLILFVRLGSLNKIIKSH